MVPTVLMAAGKEFHQEEPEKDRLVLYRSMRGLGYVYLSGLLLLSLKNDIMEEGTNFLFTLNISTAILKSSCFCNSNMQQTFNISSGEEFLSGSNSLVARE